MKNTANGKIPAMTKSATPNVLAVIGIFCHKPPIFFFFQAEDGIRDKLVTGVQTCALPIFTPEQTIAGIYWGYDAQPSLCAPVVVYNQIAVQIGSEHHLSVTENARMLAVVNVAMADAGIAAWETKYFYKFWRPVAAIREADAGTGPSGLGDGNPATVGDATWMPLGAPADNSDETNFTPPFPAYTSGHATFGGALFETLRRFYGTDHIRFTFVSDEFNGVTKDQFGNTRPLIPRTFETLSQAEDENGQSRIYLGIHWRFDKVNGIRQGEQIADLVTDTLFLPR